MWWAVSIFFFLYLVAVLLWARVLLSRKSHASMLLWTCWLLLFPPLGIPLYLVLGTDRLPHRLREPEDLVDLSAPGDARDIPTPLGYLARVQGNRLSRMSSPRLYWEGDDLYDAMEADIDAAEEAVHIQTYVWRDDDEGRRILHALIRAVERGVTVRVLVDEMGSFQTPRRFFDPLLKAGGHFSYCSTVHTRRRRFFFNLRNHRKVNLIDGRWAYVGGMNIGKEYTGRQIGPWTDLQLRFQGTVVQDLQESFVEDWRFATGEELAAPSEEPFDPEAGFPVVTVRSGPSVSEPGFLLSFHLLCNAATERLDLYTPYFVPDESIFVGLRTAAKRGVRIRLMIPTLNEHQYMVDIGRASYEQLMEAGVEIYELPGRVHHGKVFRVDDDLVFAGSHNLDVRSNKLNFELSVCFRDRETAARMDAQYEDLFARCERIDPEAFHGRPLSTRLKQGFIRLFGPVL